MADLTVYADVKFWFLSALRKDELYYKAWVKYVLPKMLENSITNCFWSIFYVYESF